MVSDSGQSLILVWKNQGEVREFHIVWKVATLNKALINWVDRSVQEYIAFSLFSINLPSIGQYGKGRGQYIPVLTSHSINKSIVLHEHPVNK